MFHNKFNINLLIQILNKKEILKTTRIYDNSIPNHPLLNKSCICLDETDNITYSVDKICKQWHEGYYIVLSLVNPVNKSHRIINYQNINCQNKYILNQIEINKSIIHFI